MKRIYPSKTVATLLTAGAFVIGGYFVFHHKPPSVSPDIKTVAPASVTPVSSDDTAQEVSQYRTIVIKTDTPGKEIADVVGLAKVDYVLAFNRLDVLHIQKSVTITIPNNLTDWSALSPFPVVFPDASGIDKLLVVSQRIQAFGAYEKGTLVRWGPVSSGKKDTPTPSKLYFTNWKGKSVVSTLEGGYILPWAFNLDNLDGIAMHQFDLPGLPASHACVRLLEADAIWMYDWAKQWILDSTGQNEVAKGTPVLVYGEYAFGKTAPWKKLAADPDATTVTVEELSNALAPEIDTINTKAAARAAIEGSN